MVLPGGVKLDLPFPCNAPFIQDPARSKVKSPSLSPTNRWLSERVGPVAGQAVLQWLGNRSLSLNERARAYDLLPQKVEARDSLESDVVQAICTAMGAVIGNAPLLLTSTGELVKRQDCRAPPNVVDEVWSPAEILTVFQSRNPPRHVLAAEVSATQRRALLSWNAMEAGNDDEPIEQLEMAEQIPRSQHQERLLRWWHWVHVHLPKRLSREHQGKVFSLSLLQTAPFYDARRMSFAYSSARRTLARELGYFFLG